MGTQKRRADPSNGTAPSPAGPTRVRRSVSPELASNVREEDEALNATVRTANAIVAAAVAESNRVIEAARARHAAAMRVALRALEIDEGQFVAIDGYGSATTVVIEMPPAKETAHA